MLSGISIFMGLTGLGFIPLPFMKATIMHIPAIIGAILEGPLVGATVGLVFGLFSIYQNITAPTLLSPVFMNPIVGFAAAVGTITNTVGVLGLTYLVFAEQYATLKDVSSSSVAGILGTIVLTNGVPECIISVLIIIPIVTRLKKILKR
jgi:uncharacterized membrane protein